MIIKKGKRMLGWFTISALILIISAVIFYGEVCLSSIFHWLYFSGENMAPSNYFIYNLEQVLGFLLVTSTLNILICIIVGLIDTIKTEVLK